MQTLLYGAHIITQNEQDEIHKEGWILLEDDRIIGIGAGAPPEVPEGTVKRCLPGRVIMPGIVNIHTHVGGTLFKGLAEDIKGGLLRAGFFPWNALSPGNPCTASVCWGPWRPSNSAPPSSMTCTTSRNPPPARRRSWVCAASSHKKIYDPDLQNLHNNDYSSVPGQAAQKAAGQTVIIVAFSLFAIILVNIGGFKSVAWTDFLQGILMVIFIAAFKAVGWSFADVNTQLSAIDPNLVQPFNESGLYSLSGVIAMPFYLFVSLVANPYCTIRLMAMTNVGRKSFKKFGLTLISVGMICMLMYMSGLFGRVLYPNLADADSVIPTIAQNLLPEWGLAIVAVGLFASMMACVDSMIHCISAMLSVDIYKRTLAAAVLAVIVTVAVSLFTKPVDPAVLNRMKGLKSEG